MTNDKKSNDIKPLIELDFKDDETFNTFKKTWKNNLKSLENEKNNILEEYTKLITFLKVTKNERVFAYSIKNLIVPSLKHILSGSYAHDNEETDKVNNIVKNVISFCLSKINTLDEYILNCLGMCFDGSLKFFKTYGLEKPIENAKVPEETEEYKIWRSKIKVNDWVDVRVNGRWKLGQVVGEHGQASWRVSYEGPLRYNATFVPKDSLTIAPKRQMSLEDIEKWRLDLEKGSVLDCLDEVDKWYTGQVLEVSEEDVKITYDGWAHKFDEWIKRTSQRLAPFKTYARGGKLEGGVAKDSAEQVLLDDKDPEDVAGIYRGSEWGSYYVADNINYFDEEKGFTEILKILETSADSMESDEKFTISIGSVRRLVEIIGKMRIFLARPFANKFIAELKNFVYRIVLGLDGPNLRNLKKEDLDLICRNLRGLLRRILKPVEAEKDLEGFCLSSALMRFNCQIVERRINAMSYFQETLKRHVDSGIVLVSPFAKPNTEKKSVPLVTWFEDNKILESCFAEDSHAEIIKRTSPIFEFLTNQRKFTTKHVDLIWKALYSAIQAGLIDKVNAIYHVLGEDLAIHLDDSDALYIFQKMIDIPIKKFTKKTIDLICQLTKWATQVQAETCKLAIDLMWRVIVGSDSEEVVPYTISKLDVIFNKSNGKGLRYEYLGKCIKQIEANKSSAQIMDVFMKIIDTYRGMEMIKPSRGVGDAFNKLSEEFKVIEACLSSISSLHGQGSKEEKDDLDIDVYNAEMRKSFDFMQFILTNSTLQLSKDMLLKLWKTSFTNSKTLKEKDLLLLFLKRACDMVEKDEKICSEEDLVFLFREKISKELLPSTLNAAGYECMEKFFILVNTAEKKVLTRGMSFTIVDFDLDSISLFWSIAFDNKSEKVAMKSVDFLNVLNKKVDVTIVEKIGTIRQNYIEKVMEHFKKYVKEKDDVKIKRCLQLLFNLLDNDTAKIRSHGVDRGKKMQVRLLNNVHDSKKKKKIELEVRSSDTFRQFKDLVGQTLEEDAINLRFIYSGKSLEADKNELSLEKLKIKPDTFVAVLKKNHGSSGGLIQNRDMVPGLQKALGEIFDRFSKDASGTWTQRDAREFFIFCAQGHGLSGKVEQMFRQYGIRNDQLEKPGFLSYYREQCTDDAHQVWRDLMLCGYNRDFKQASEVEDEKKLMALANEKELSSKYLLSSNNEYFDLLFECLNLEKSIASKIWVLLQKLPTNPDLEKNIKSLDKVNNDDPDWNVLLDGKSAYKLLYSLQIIGILTSEDEPTKKEEEKEGKEQENKEEKEGKEQENKESENKEQENKQPEQKEKKEDADTLDWQKKFLAAGGFEHLYKILLSGDNFLKDERAMITTRKSCLALLLKMFHTFIISAISVKGPMYKKLKRIRSESDVGVENLEKKEKEVKEKESEDAGDMKFVALVRQMSFGFAGKLLEFIDFNKLLNHLILVSEQSATSNTITSSDIDVVKFATELWVSCLVYKPLLVNDQYKTIKSQPKQFLTVLFAEKSADIRKQFAFGVNQLCKNFAKIEDVKTPTNFFLDLLLSNLVTAKSSTKAKENCEEFYWLLYMLLERGVKTDTKKFAPFVEKLIKILMTHKSSETEVTASSDGNKDKVMVGLLNILQVLLDSDIKFREGKTDLFKQIFTTFIFAPDAKAKTEGSRTAAFSCLISLIKGVPENLLQAITLLNGIFKEVTPVSGWGYNPTKRMKSVCGYVGLKNQGATCYMNSVLQQFFMIPAFRRAITKAEDKAEDKKDSMLTQLQKMTAFLLGSEKQAYNTSDFCKTYKDGGKPINVRIQQDAQEFLNVFCDRLDGFLKQTEYRDLVKNLFGGKLINQRQCKGACKQIREREENYFNVGLEVKNKKSLEDALKAYVQGEVISGFKCDACARRTEITRRTCLGELGNNIIFHLKRFQLNFETWQNEKLNCRFPFPDDIDLEPYTKEGLERLKMEQMIKEFEAEQKDTSGLIVPEKYSVRAKEYYQYKLGGIIIHVGNAQGGHYYSVIKERGNYKIGDTPQWIEFNDHIIRPFDYTQVDEQCFGGENTNFDRSYAISFDKFLPNEKTQNAYMLVYERVVPQKQGDKEAATEAEEKELESKKALESLNDLGNCEDLVTEENKEVVKEDNLQFLKDRQVYSSDTFKFLVDLLDVFKEDTSKKDEVESKEKDGLLDFIKLVTKFAMNSVARTSEHAVFPELVKRLNGLMSDYPSAAEWILQFLCEDRPGLINSMLLVTREENVRKGFNKLIVQAVTVIAKKDKDSWNETKEIEILNEKTKKVIKKTVPTSYAKRLVGLLLDLIEESPKNWARFNEYWTTLYQLLNRNNCLQELYMEKGVIARLGNLVLGDKSPIREGKVKYKMGHARLQAPNFIYLFKIIAMLTRCCYTPATVEEKVKIGTSLRDESLILSEDDLKILTCVILYDMPLTRGYPGTSALVEIASHLCYENKEFTYTMLEIALVGIEKAQDNTVKPYFDLLEGLIIVDDTLRDIRATYILTNRQQGVINSLTSYKVSYKYAYAGIKFLFEILDRNKWFAEKMMEVRGDWDWMDVWMQRAMKLPELQRQTSRAETLEKYKKTVTDLGGDFIIYQDEEQYVA